MGRYAVVCCSYRFRVSSKRRLEGLSCVKGNLHAQFLEGWAGVIPPGYSTTHHRLARRRRSPEGPARSAAQGAASPAGSGNQLRRRRTPHCL